MVPNAPSISLSITFLVISSSRRWAGKAVPSRVSRTSATTSLRRNCADLRTYPFDSIKIDKPFIGGLCSTSGSDRAVVQAIINLGEALGLTVTAEGVESEQRLELLEKDRCHEAQGYYLSRPLDSAGLGALLHLASARPAPYL